MKKRLVPFLLLMLISGVSFAGTYTLKVTVGDTVPACYATGSFNNWNPSSHPMTKLSDSPRVFTLDIEVADADVATSEYKYLSGPDWKYEQTESASFKLSELSAEGDTVSSFKAIYDPGFEKDVTIDVLVPKDLFVCYITGSFNGWNSNSHEMILVDSTANGKEYTITFHTLDTTTLEFKFLAGPGWPYEQSNSTNYNYMTDGGVVVCDAFKSIFDPSKVGDITINITVPAETFEVWVVGSYNSWDMSSSIQATKVSETLYTAVIPQVAEIEYKIWCHDDWAYEEAVDDQGTLRSSNRVASFETGPEFNITVEFWAQLWTPVVDRTNYVKTAASAYPEGSPMLVNFRNIDPQTNDWIGIYPRDTVPDGDPGSLDWAYTEGDSGTIEFTTALVPGAYTVFLLCCDGYDIKAQYDFIVAADTSAYLVASALTYLETDTLVFDYNSPSWSDTDWIGVYNPGDDPGGGAYSIIWKYIPGVTGIVTFTNPDEHALEPGEYWAGLFCCDGYDMLAETFFVVQAAEPTDLSPQRANEMILYPNPTSGMVSIRSESGDGIRNIKIYSLAGSLVHVEDIPGLVSEHTLNLEFLKNGIYMVRATTENGVITRQLFIQ